MASIAGRVGTGCYVGAVDFGRSCVTPWVLVAPEHLVVEAAGATRSSAEDAL